jgi:undecaprenyl-diphosphatase
VPARHAMDQKGGHARSVSGGLPHRFHRLLGGRHAAVYLGAALAAAAFATTLVIAVLALTLEPLTASIDDALLTWVARRQSPGWSRAAVQITALGNTATLAVLLIWTAAILVAIGRRFEAVVALATFAGGRLLTEALKAAFDRERPDQFAWGADVVSASFPSAHAMSAAIAYGTLAYLVGWVGAGTAVRRAGWTLAILLTGAVAASRVYLGVHYPTDAVVGVLGGALWTVVVLSAIPAGRYLARR